MKKTNRNGLIVLSGAVFIASIYLMWPASKVPELLQKREFSTPETVATDFKSWQSSASRDVDQGIELAKVRAKHMRALIRKNPEQAIQESLSLSEWNRLPPEIQAHVETPFSTVADVEVLIGCGEESSQTGITTELPGVDAFETFVYGRRNSQSTKVGVPVQGIHIDGVGVLREETFQLLGSDDEAAALQLFPVVIPDPGGASVAALAGGHVFYFKNQAAFDEANKRLSALEDLPGPSAGAQALFGAMEDVIVDDEIDFDALEMLAEEASEEWTGTPRDMYVIMVDFSDLTGEPADPAVVSNVINTVVSQQVWDMSYGKTYINGIVNTKTYRVSNLSTAYVDTLASYPNAQALHAEAVALVGADGIDLSGYDTVCVFYSHISGMGFAGLGSIGGSKLWVNGFGNSETIAHELGHNYGAHHSNFWEPTNGNPVDPGGQEIEYGDFTDLMGSGQVPSGHLNSRHKKQLGWLDPENWLTATTSGTYRIYRSDHRETSGMLRGLEIDKGAGEQYWVGIRQELGLYETFCRGAYVLWKQAVGEETNLLDMSPLSAAGKYDGGLALGDTYSDTAAGVHITPTARGGKAPNEWMDITVNLGAFPGNTAPSATLSGTTNTALKSSALFTVSASDTDGDELAYFWDVGDGLVKPNSPTLSATWLSGSTATVRCVVSDMKGGTTTVSQNVMLSGPLDSWSKRTSGTTRDLFDAAQGGGMVIAVGNAGHTTRSANGTDWTYTDVGTPYFFGIAHDGSQFIAVGDDYDSSDGFWKGTVYTSPSGTSWTRRMLSGDTLNDVAYGNGTYVGVGYAGTIVRSTDGISWSSVASGTTTDLRGVSFGDNTFVIVGDAGDATPHVVLSSTNGLSWTDRSSGVNIVDDQWLFEIEYVNDRFLAGGWSSSVQHSTDQGQSFQTTLNMDYEMLGFAYSEGNYLATGVYSSDIDDDINLVSLDGINWSELNTSDKDPQQAAVAFNGTFITVGLNGSIWQSGSLADEGSGFAVWQIENGDGLGADRDPFEDADFDGHLNLEEYAMGSSASDAEAVPVVATSDASDGYFKVTWERNGIAEDVAYTVERASNLASNDWSAANTVTMIDHDTNLTVRSTFPLSTQTAEFMRLKVELQ